MKKEQQVTMFQKILQVWGGLSVAIAAIGVGLMCIAEFSNLADRYEDTNWFILVVIPSALLALKFSVIPDMNRSYAKKVAAKAIDRWRHETANKDSPLYGGDCGFSDEPYMDMGEFDFLAAHDLIPQGRNPLQNESYVRRIRCSQFYGKCIDDALDKVG